MNDNCLGKLHLLVNTLCRYYAMMIYYADTLYKYIISSNIKDVVDHSRQLVYQQKE